MPLLNFTGLIHSSSETLFKYQGLLISFFYWKLTKNCPTAIEFVFEFENTGMSHALVDIAGPCKFFFRDKNKNTANVEDRRKP